MGTHREQIFPFFGVRFLSISDHYDSKDYRGKSSDIEVQFKGLIADFYVKDQSVKVKAAVRTKRENREYCCGSASYGYQINPENKKELLIVEDEAQVIKKNISPIRQNMKNRIRIFEKKSCRQSRKKTALEKRKKVTKIG